jgi:8-oxo-dGDP phosphatase
MPKDQPFDIPLIKSERIYEGKIWNVVSEDFLFNGEILTREFVEHTGAVAVLTIDENEEVLFIKQYRRPVRSFLWEIPAGLLDIPGESKIDAAKRELAEEAGLVAKNWEELITFHTTPGGSSETITIFVAKNLSKSETVFETSGEEKDMEQIWVSVPEALKMVLSSDIKSPTAVVGVMAYATKSGQEGVSQR